MNGLVGVGVGVVVVLGLSIVAPSAAPTPGASEEAAAAAHPCPDNPEYGKTVARTNPRLFRAALKITF
jgi:hypothetical protein